ncbi:Lrp/AsnC family transcriptional regulator [Nocardia panacis]|nr:AsnC family transcriptional regulator [Nocardia panacis]
MDDVDLGLVQALRVDGRAQFRTIAEVLEVSENTVARRYRRLRAEAGLRVIGSLDSTRLGRVQWTIRLSCTPDAAGAVAKALAAREDTHYVHLLSAGTEVSCTVSTGGVDEQALLLHKLPRTSRIVAMSAHLLLSTFRVPDTGPEPTVLTDEQIAVLRPDPIDIDVAAPPLHDGDRAMLRALNRDGRAPYAELAAATGWSESTVRRRLELLRRTGILRIGLDIPAAALGFGVEARLWMRVEPGAAVAVGSALAAHREISFAALTTGATNLVAAVVCRDTVDLSRYLTERLPELSGIIALETAPVIRTVKRAGTPQL